METKITKEYLEGALEILKKATEARGRGHTGTMDTWLYNLDGYLQGGIKMLEEEEK